jgi:hypothetical protein
MPALFRLRVNDCKRHGLLATPLIGRLIARGLDDELKGSAYIVIDGVISPNSAIPRSWLQNCRSIRRRLSSGGGFLSMPVRRGFF